MIERAKEGVARHGTSVLRWILADALDVALHLPGPVDCVLTANTFRGVPDQERLATEVRKVSRPGGVSPS